MEGKERDETKDVGTTTITIDGLMCGRLHGVFLSSSLVSWPSITQKGEILIDLIILFQAYI